MAEGLLDRWLCSESAGFRAEIEVDRTNHDLKLAWVGQEARLVWTGQDLNLPFAKVEVSSWLGPTRVCRNVYVASLDESGRSADSGGSLLGGSRSVGSLIPRFDSRVLLQRLSRAMGVPRLNPFDDQVSQAKRSIGVEIVRPFGSSNALENLLETEGEACGELATPVADLALAMELAAEE
ncbi:hypothetical protein GW17_00014909 [Ensete ventricosum]|nr:hypothetical protein GW17_00014909 [Ensete ventricosum]